MNGLKRCSICQKIDEIKAHIDPYFVLALSTGYVVIGDYQFYHGYTLFLCKRHVTELHKLPRAFRQQFLKDMSIVAEAVFKTFKPHKLNYELLGNTVPHLHWHIFPRYKNDLLLKRPIWCVDQTVTMSESVKPSKKQLQTLKAKLLQTFKSLGVAESL